MYIGRIITNAKKIDSFEFIDKTNDTSKIDSTIPTLIVGKSLAESMFGKDKVKILDRQLGKNLYWTYSKTEKRSAYEEDINEFNNFVIAYMLKNTKYQSFSLFRNGLSRKKGFLRFLDDESIEKAIYLNRNHAYIYYGKGPIIGISLNEAEYIGIPVEKCVKRMLKNRKNKLITNTNFLSYTILNKIGDSLYIIPYLYSVKIGS